MKYTFEIKCPIMGFQNTYMKIKVKEIINANPNVIQDILSAGMSALYNQVSSAESKQEFPRKVFQFPNVCKKSIYDNEVYTLSLRKLKQICLNVPETYYIYIGYLEKSKCLCPQMYISDSEGKDVRKLIATDLSDYNPYGKLTGDICEDLIEKKINHYER